jgi:hypothetical protein
LFKTIGAPWANFCLKTRNDSKLWPKNQIIMVS